MTEASTNGTGTRAGRRAAVARPANGRNTTQPNLQERGSGLPERALNYASTGALEDPARPWKRELDDMIQRDPQIQAVMIALILPLLTAEGHVEPGDKDSGEAKFIEQCLTAPEWDGGMTTPIHMILEQEATAMFYRQAFFEKVWLRDGDGKFRYKKLAFRPATTCRIRHDIGEGPNGSGNGSFNGFMQEGVRPGSGEWFTEEFDPLYSYVFVHGHAQRPLLGTSLLQTAWHEHMHKNKLRWLQFRGFAKWGNGILVAETERMDDVEQDALTDALNEVLDGGALVVGEGEMPQLLTASGSAGFLEVLQYIDTGIARSVLLQALQLGTGSNTGSWALSKDHTDFYLMSCEARLRQIEYTRNAYMIPPLIEQNYPGTPSYPTWHFPGLSEEGKELAKEIFIALLGRPQASVHPVIKATVEKTVAQKLGGDPDNIPEWDDPEREVEQVPPDAAADTEPTNDPQRAAEAGALASSLQALRGETGQRAASEIELAAWDESKIKRDEAGKFAERFGISEHIEGADIPADFSGTWSGTLFRGGGEGALSDAESGAGQRVSEMGLAHGTFYSPRPGIAELYATEGVMTQKAKDLKVVPSNKVQAVYDEEYEKARERRIAARKKWYVTDSDEDEAAYERATQEAKREHLQKVVTERLRKEGVDAYMHVANELVLINPSALDKPKVYRKASEQGDTPLGESVTYERFLELADLYGDDEAERMLREYVRDEEGRFADVPGGGPSLDNLAQRTADLPKDQQQALADYSVQDFIDINGGLREGDLPAAWKGTANQLELACAHPLPEMKVYRGGTDPQLQELLMDGELAPGLVVEDPGFMSTSVKSGIAEQFAATGWGENPYDLTVMNEIFVPEGTSGAYLEPVSLSGGQEEILLQRNSKLELDDYRFDEGTGDLRLLWRVV